MVCGRIIEQVSAEGRMQERQLLIFILKLCPLIHIFTSFLFLECDSASICNILMVLGRIIEQVSLECHMQE